MHGGLFIGVGGRGVSLCQLFVPLLDFLSCSRKRCRESFLCLCRLRLKSMVLGGSGVGKSKLDFDSTSLLGVGDLVGVNDGRKRAEGGTLPIGGKPGSMVR